jgi:RNA polymerase sigma-70 factor (ECF subfamily)
MSIRRIVIVSSLPHHDDAADVMDHARACGAVGFSLLDFSQFTKDYSAGNKLPARGVYSRRPTRHLGGVLGSRELSRFEAVVLPHLDAAYTLARYLTRNATDAEDVVQDACLRAMRHFASFSGEEDTSARAWLLAIVRNTAYSARRRRRVEEAATEFDEKTHSDAVAEEHPETALLRTAAKESIARALDGLGPEYREVIVLRELQGLSYKEISDVAGVPVGTVMSRLSRARARLQEALREVEGH